jgi:hypothetical protein
MIRDQLSKAEELAPSIKLFWRIISAEGLWAWRGQDAFPVWSLRRDFVGRLPGLDARAELLALLRPFLVLGPSVRRHFWPVTHEPEAGPGATRFPTLAESRMVV